MLLPGAGHPGLEEKARGFGGRKSSGPLPGEVSGRNPVTRAPLAPRLGLRAANRGQVPREEKAGFL